MCYFITLLAWPGALQFGRDPRPCHVRLAPMKRYFASATFDDAPSVSDARVLAAYGRSLSSMWDEWLAWIRSPV